MRENLAGSPLLQALDTTPWRPMHTRITVALEAAAMLIWARSGGPDGAKVPLEHLESGFGGRIT